MNSDPEIRILTMIVCGYVCKVYVSIKHTAFQHQNLCCFPVCGSLIIDSNKILHRQCLVIDGRNVRPISVVSPTCPSYIVDVLILPITVDD